MILAKYKDLGRGWCTKPSVRAYGSCLWRGIYKEYSEFQRWITYRVGNGSRTLFWHDGWCGPTLFSIAFPGLFSLARLKNGLVRDHFVRENDHISWDLHFRREVNNWKILGMSSLLQRFDRVGVEDEEELDQRQWQPNNGFSVKSFYNVICPIFLQHHLEVKNTFQNKFLTYGSFISTRP